MHRVFHEPHANIIASVVEGVEGAGEVIVHRLSDDAFRVQRVMVYAKSVHYHNGDLVIEGSMDDVEGMSFVKSGGVNKMREISSLQAQRLILKGGLLGNIASIDSKVFKLTDQSDNNKELRFITEIDDVLSELNTFMENMESLKYQK